MFHLKDGFTNIKKSYIIELIVISVILNLSANDFCIANDLPDSGVNKKMVIQRKDTIKEQRFKNISTAPSYIKFKLKESNSEKVIHVLMENTELALYLAGAQYDRKGATLLPDNFSNFIEDKYIPFLVKNEGDEKELDISDFPTNSSAKTHFNNKSIKEFLISFAYRGSLKLEQLAVKTEEELISKYFDYDNKDNSGYLKKEYIHKLDGNRAFISLLLDLNYDVGRLDIAPILRIRKIK